MATVASRDEILDSKLLRLAIVEMIYRSKEGHIPSAFSILDILIALYSSIPGLSSDFSKHKFVLSKGHGCAALYVVLASMGILDWKDIELYGSNGSKLGGHPDRTKQAGIEASSGSLGHGFPFAVGLALAEKILKTQDARTYVLLGDGECQEGTTWEAASVAINQNLNNLIAIIDWNGSSSQLQPKEHLQEKWSAFGWKTLELDGHNISQMISLFEEIHSNPQIQPVVLLAKTTKGKGVSFIEGHGNWHHKIPNEHELQKIIEELQH